MRGSRWCVVSLLAVAATCGAACSDQEPSNSTSPPPSATATFVMPVPTQPDAQKEAAYLDAIEANGGGVGAVPPAKLIALGQNICSATETGSSDTQIRSLVMAEGYSKLETATLVTSARQVLCS